MLQTEIKKKIIDDSSFRRSLARQSLSWFSHIYLAHYIKLKTPEFHFDIYKNLEDESKKFIEVIGFRDSAKSTISMLIYVLWCAIFKKKNFIVIISETRDQIKAHISAIIRELESNPLLIRDFGQFQRNDDWTATNILLPNGVRIMARSVGQKVRGLRHLEYRPDLIVADDVEDTKKVRVKENRDKIWEWFNSEIVPMASGNSRIIVLGNMLHNDSFVVRLKKRILNERIGEVLEYPLIKEGTNLWPEKYPDVELAKKQVGLRAFDREYLLRVLPSEGQIVKENQILDWEGLPEKIKAIAIFCDPAISEKQSADYTAIDVCLLGEDRKFYNYLSYQAHINFHATKTKIKAVYNDIKLFFEKIPILVGVEDVAYQKALIQELQREYLLPVRAVKRLDDKKARLEILTPLFESGRVLFAKNQDELKNQILSFTEEGYKEEHDDLFDAFEGAVDLLRNFGAGPNIRIL